jgi:hypothetical protein
LIRKQYGIDMPVRTVGEYLRRWGYTAKVPRRHAKDQDPEEVRQWLAESYPGIHHMSNAYVAGPALFPRIGSTLTAMALARNTAQAIVSTL